jgi:lambda repressor-like predicted transcriptional regulator
MAAFEKIPTHIDYAHRMAEVAAEMAGYDLRHLEDRSIERDDAKTALYRDFIRKGFQAIEVLGPAVVDFENYGGDKVPDDVREAGYARDEHALTTVRTWRGLSIEDLATAAGLSPDFIRSIEAREVSANEMHDFAMAKALSVSPHALTDWRMPIDR